MRINDHMALSMDNKIYPELLKTMKLEEFLGLVRNILFGTIQSIK